ncbi:MAG: MCE family protein [Bacteroidales bacterium]|nr:MCE family protein [Bacteroidales bacterium]
MKISKEIIIGLLVLLALVLLFWGMNFLKGKNFLSQERVFYGVYSNIEGLVKTNPVVINGLNVGQVKDMYFDPAGNNRVIVEFLVTNEVGIPKNSVARIYSSDLLGSKAVEIRLGNSDAFAQTGDTLITDVELSLKEEVNRQVQPLKRKAEDLMLSIDSVITVVQYIFNRATRENLNRSFESIANTFDNIESTTYSVDTLMTAQKKRIERILSNIESITMNLNNNQENFNHIISNLSALSDSLARARISETLISTSNAMSEVATIVNRINSGEGSLGLLVNNDSLYIELEKSARDLNLLLEDIRNNPKKYVKFSVF